MKTKTSYLILAALFLIPAVVVAASFFNRDRIIENRDVDSDTTIAEVLDSNMSDTMPLGRTMRQVGLTIRFNTGEAKQDGIFISSKGLMKDIQPVEDARVLLVSRTLAEVASYAREMDIETYLSVIPSASAILQQNLPLFSSTVNQKNVIDNIYNQFYGKLVTINSYNTLLENREKYIYYRTEDNLTALGGYYVYKDLIRRMMGPDGIIPLKSFSVEYDRNDFFGNLYQKVPYERVDPDVLMFYHIEDRSGNYRVEKTVNGQKSLYHSLYTRGYSESEGQMHSYLGGASGVTNVSSTNPYDQKLLIFADDTFLSYMPFLANHYSEITVVNLFEDVDNLGNIKFSDYNQILFACSVERFTNSLDLSVLIEVLENQRKQ